MKSQIHTHRSLSIAFGVALLLPAAASAQPLVNPNFDPPDEDISDNPNPGYGPLSGWDRSVTNIGVNSSTQPFLNQTAHSGSYVAFIQGAGNISQEVVGFEPSKLYSVTYFVSERGSAGASTDTTVSLDGGTTSFTHPDTIVKTDKFRRIVSSPLPVSGATSTLRLSTSDGPNDDSLLIDTVSISRAVPVVPDGGFEFPVQPNTDQTTRYKLGNGAGGGTLVGSAWDFETSLSGIVRNGSAFTPFSSIYAPEGSQAAVLRSTSQFSTMVDGFEAGVTYTLSFDARGRTESSLGPNVTTVKLGAATLEFAGDTTVTPGGTWTTYTSDEFTSDGGSLLLVFQGLTGGDNSTFLDDVRFNFIAEPSAPYDFQLTIAPNAGNPGNYDFAWNSRPGMVYDLVSSTDLSTHPSTWLVWDGREGIAPSGTGTNTLVNIPGDGLRRFFVVIERAAPPLLDENFEDGVGGFTATVTTGSTWQLGTPDSSGLGGSVTAGNDGSLRCWGINLGAWDGGNGDPGFYANPTTASCLRSPDLDLDGYTSAQLTFAEALDVEGNDNAVVKLIDAATDLEIATIYTVDDGDDNNAPWAPANGGVAIDLSAGLGKMVYLQWCLSGTGGVTADYLGWYIDDIVVTAE